MLNHGYFSFGGVVNGQIFILEVFFSQNLTGKLIIYWKFVDFRIYFIKVIKRSIIKRKAIKNMKLCMMTCMMPYSTPREIVEAAVYCGMTAIDWISTHNTDPALLRKISEDAGLKIAAHTMIKEKFLNYDGGRRDNGGSGYDAAAVSPPGQNDDG